jgi:hypothetical protein
MTGLVRGPAVTSLLGNAPLLARPIAWVLEADGILPVRAARCSAASHLLSISHWHPPQTRTPAPTAAGAHARTIERAGSASDDAVMALAAGRTQDGLARVPALAGAAVGRVGDEAAGIWRDARALSRRPAATVDGPAKPSGDQVYLAWYGGLTAMALLRLIEWRLAAVIAGVHTVERHTHRRRLEEFLEGIDAGGV